MKRAACKVNCTGHSAKKRRLGCWVGWGGMSVSVSQDVILILYDWLYWLGQRGSSDCKPTSWFFRIVQVKKKDRKPVAVVLIHMFPQEGFRVCVFSLCSNLFANIV